MNPVFVNAFLSMMIDQSIYVSDVLNDCVTKWIGGAKHRVIAGDGQDEEDELAQLFSDWHHCQATEHSTFHR